MSAPEKDKATEPAEKHGRSHSLSVPSVDFRGLILCARDNMFQTLSGTAIHGGVRVLGGEAV
jgi:hypothetical protein